MMGWECPVCGEANAPQNVRCVNGPHVKTVSTNNTASCTCAKRPWGLEPTSAACPIHTWTTLQDNNTAPNVAIHFSVNGDDDLSLAQAWSEDAPAHGL